MAIANYSDGFIGLVVFPNYLCLFENRVSLGEWAYFHQKQMCARDAPWAAEAPKVPHVDRHRTSRRSCCRLHLVDLSKPQHLGVSKNGGIPQFMACYMILLQCYMILWQTFVILWQFNMILYQFQWFSMVIMRINQWLNGVPYILCSDPPTPVGNAMMLLILSPILTVAILGPCSTTSITRPNQLRTNINHGGSWWLSYFSDPALHSRGAVS